MTYSSQEKGKDFKPMFEYELICNRCARLENAMAFERMKYDLPKLSFSIINSEDGKTPAPMLQVANSHLTVCAVEQDIFSISFQLLMVIAKQLIQQIIPILQCPNQYPIMHQGLRFTILS
ncbi:hypothetical protein Ancab_024533 [Ancistrocladus abbreviatus]